MQVFTFSGRAYIFVMEMYDEERSGEEEGKKYEKRLRRLVLHGVIVKRESSRECGIKAVVEEQ